MPGNVNRLHPCLFTVASSHTLEDFAFEILLLFPFLSYFFLFPPTIFFALSHCGAVLNIYCGQIPNQFINVEILLLVANVRFIMHNIVVFFIVTSLCN